MNPDTSQVLIAALVALSSGGGLVAGIRAWQDKKKGAQETTLEGFRSVIGTLREEVDRLKQDRESDRARIDRVEQQIAVERDLRWSAIQYVRILLAWVSQHLPGVDPPAIPTDLADHITVPGKDPTP